MIFRFVDKKENTEENIDIPTAHTGKINASLNGYLISPPVQLDKDANIMTISIPDIENEEELHSFTNWIKELRKKRHWTQTEFAKITNLSPAYVSQTERGFLVPSKKAIGSIVNALLFWNTEEENTTPANEQPAFTGQYSIMKQDIFRQTNILLKTDNYHCLELIKNTLLSIEDLMNAIDKNSFESEIEFYKRLAVSTLERDLNSLISSNTK